MRCLVRNNGTQRRLNLSFGRNASCMGKRHDNVFVFLIIDTSPISREVILSPSFTNLGGAGISVL
jgi:hypothetical protein